MTKEFWGFLSFSGLLKISHEIWESNLKVAVFLILSACKEERIWIRQISNAYFTYHFFYTCKEVANGKLLYLIP